MAGPTQSTGNFTTIPAGRTSALTTRASIAAESIVLITMTSGIGTGTFTTTIPVPATTTTTGVGTELAVGHGPGVPHSGS
jgi:hypothetical protein